MNDRSAEITELMEDVESFLSDAPETPTIPEVQPITVLETWLKVLGTADIGDNEPKVSMQFASHLIRSYPELKFRDLKAVDARFREKLLDFRDILQAEVDGEPAALKRMATDAADNRHLYLNAILGWQQSTVEWERNWDPSDVNAAVEFAACAEAHRFALSPMGLLAHLEAIGLEFGPDDEQTVIDAVMEQEGR